MWTCTTCMPGPEEGQKEVSVFQELESQIISSHQVGAGNRRLTGAHYWGANSSAQVPLLISSWASMLAWSYLMHFLVFGCQGQQPSQTHHFLIFFWLYLEMDPIIRLRIAFYLQYGWWWPLIDPPASNSWIVRFHAWPSCLLHMVLETGIPVCWVALYKLNTHAAPWDNINRIKPCSCLYLLCRCYYGLLKKYSIQSLSSRTYSWLLKIVCPKSSDWVPHSG